MINLSLAQVGWGQNKPPQGSVINRQHNPSPRTLCLLFNEGAGATVQNIASRANNGTLSGTAVRIAGRSNQAVEFNTTGSTGKVSFSGISFGTTMYVGGWIFPMSGGASYGLIWGDAAGTAGLYFRNASRLLDMVFTPGGDHQSSTAIPFNVWTHIAVSISGGSGTFYVNGRPDGSFSSWPGTAFDRMGVDNFTDFFRGRMESWLGTAGESLTPGAAYHLYDGGYQFMQAPPDFYAPRFYGVGGATLDNLTAAGAGSFAGPVYGGDGAALMGELGVSGAGLFIPAPYIGLGAAALGELAVSGAGLFTAPPTDLLDAIESYWARTPALTALTSGFRLNVTPPGDPLPWIRAENISETLPGMSIEDEPEDVMFSITTTDLAVTKRYGAILKYWLDSGPESKGPPRSELVWVDPITGLAGYERYNLRFASKPYRVPGLGPGGMPLFRYDIVYRFICNRTGALP